MVMRFKCRNAIDFLFHPGLRRNASIFFLIYYSSAGLVFPQEKNSVKILVTGKIIDAGSLLEIPYSLVVNKRTSHGIFADQHGSFSMVIDKQDTILISARGYHTMKLCYRDSIDKAAYFFQVQLLKLQVNLKELMIFPERKIEEIEKDISTMKKFNADDYMLTDFDAIRSPITYFYQLYSRREKSKRKMEELMIEEKKREIIKELLRMYSKGKFIEIEEEGFDLFIDYCRIDIDFLKNATQYEFMTFIKKKHENYLKINQK